MVDMNAFRQCGHGPARIGNAVERPKIEADEAATGTPRGTATCTSDPRRTLVMGVGNTLQGDDGVGVHAIHALEKHAGDWPGLRLYDAGTLGTTLLVEVEEAGNLIVIDAMRMGSPAGTVRCFVDEDMDHWMRRGKASSVHEVGLSELLDLARLRDRLPRHRALVGVEPGHIGWSDSLSEALAGSIDEVRCIVLELLRGWHEAAT